LTDITGRGLTVDEVKQLAANIAAATGLTRLVMYADMKRAGQRLHVGVEVVPEEAAEVARSASVCGGLARLTNLQDLEVWGPRLAPGDAMALTALTGLTRLSLRGIGHGLGNAAAVALARSLTQLSCLDIQAARSAEVAAAVADLTQLTKLRLND
jgi:hypothetical protein